MSLDLIQLLPDAIANQIAAGEVVQRPASVVKELMENAIDAEATQIQLLVKEGGKTMIQVVDNGKGMSENDARMCFERHATSKIRGSEDLFTIRTKGFRGEAMASIAAVAQVELKTKRREDELGTLVQIDGSEIKKYEPMATVDGSSVAVKNLFFNVPARRNFLKSTSLEQRYIVDEFHRVALAHPEIAFKLFQNDMEVYHLNAGNLGQRIVALFGGNYREQLVAVNEETPYLKVSGYIGKPDQARKTRGQQFFFVNKRFIKNPYLNHAVLNAYEGLIPESHYPFYTLFLEIDPCHVDVNVHPTKTEVKFDDERMVYGVLKSGLRQSLGLHHVAPSLDFGVDVNFASAPKPGAADNQAQRKDFDYGRLKSFGSGEGSGGGQASPYTGAEKLHHWEKLYEGLKNADREEAQSSGNPTEEGEPIVRSFSSAMNQSTEKNPKQGQTKGDTKTLQLHGKYIITQVKTGLMFIDQHLAHERILYEKFLKSIERQKGSCQQSLFPEVLSFDPADFSLLMEHEAEIKALGFSFTEFGKNSIQIDGVPVDAAGQEEKKLLEGLLEQLKFYSSELSLPRKENVARAMAKRAAIKYSKGLTAEEMETLVGNLFACQNPNYTADGQEIFKVLDIQKIDQYFNKK